MDDIQIERVNVSPNLRGEVVFRQEVGVLELFIVACFQSVTSLWI